MSELYFRLGKVEGFTASSVADKKEGYTNPIRELLQNSLDASREAGNAKCVINIHIETISKSQIPHINDYEKILDKAIKTQQEKNSFNANASRAVAAIKQALDQQDIPILMFSDNGKGMSSEQIDAIFDERSIKGDEKGSVGSFGVGHLASYSLSSLRYVLYATKYHDGNGGAKTLFTGSPILAGYSDGDAERGGGGRIVEKAPKNEKGPSFDYPEIFPRFIESKMENLDRGTMVIILGLSENWNDDAEYAIAGNFFHAIAHEGLSVSVHQDGHQRAISDDKIESLIVSKKDNQRARRDSILSGKAVYQAWQTVTEQDTQKTIELSNAEKVHVCIKSDENTDSVIVLVRNGMVIARHDSMLSNAMNKLKKDTSLVPFAAVIDVDQQDAPVLFELVKGAEGPHHNELVKSRLGKTEEKRLKDLFEELSEKMKGHLTTREQKSFDLPLFPVPSKAEGTGGKNSRGQERRAQRKTQTPKPPKPKPSDEGEDKKRPKPIVMSRNLESQNAVQYTDEGDQWKVRLRVVPKNQESAKDEVYLSMCLAEDNDNEEANTYLDFMAVEINGRTIKIPDFVDVEKDGKWTRGPANKSQVKLGSLEQSKQYNITATVEKSNGIGSNMKVALLPILGLKQRKNTKG